MSPVPWILIRTRLFVKAVEEKKTYHVNQNLKIALVAGVPLQQLCGIVLLPLLLLVLSKVTLEGLLAPGAVDRVRNGRECRDRLVFARVAKVLLAFIRLMIHLIGKWKEND